VSVDTYLCPGCDKEVLVGSRGCPHCNPPAKRSKRRTTAASHGQRGRRRDTSRDGLDLSDEDFDYDAFVAREFGGKPHRSIGIRWYWWATGAVLLVLIVLAGGRLCGWGTSAWW